MTLFLIAEELPNITISIQPILVHIVSFLIFFLLLSRFLFTPIRKILQARSEKFESEYSEVKKFQAELQKKIAEYEQHLTLAEEEKRQIILNAMKQAEEYRKEILKKADGEVQEHREKALRNLEIEIESRWKALREKVLDTTFRLAEKLLEEELTEARQKKLLNKFIEEITDEHRAG